MPVNFNSLHTQPNESYVAEGLSYAEFLAQFADTHAEWVDGKVILLVNNWQHQQILIFLTALLDTYLSLRPIGLLTIAGFQMKWSESSAGREPDLMLILNAHQDRIEENRLNGVADIAVEIVSPESRSRDYITKYDEYEQAGVPEYWLIDPDRQLADIYHLDEAGLYRRVEKNALHELISPLLPDFALDPAQLWGVPPKGAAIYHLVQQMLEK